MLHRYIKLFFEYMKNIISGLQIALIFLAFFTIVYWVLSLGGQEWVQVFNPIFGNIYNFVHTFYQRTVEYDEATVDFTFFVGALLMCLISWGLNYANEYLKVAEQKYMAFHESIKSRLEEQFNKNLEIQYKKEQRKIKIFVVMINILINDISNDEKIAENSIEMIKMKDGVFKQIKEELSRLEQIQFKSTNQGILLHYSDFENVDRALVVLELTLRNIQKKYRENRQEVDFFIGIDALPPETVLSPFYARLSMLLKLRISNEILCLPTFASRYSLISNPKYIIDSRGIYKMGAIEENIFNVINITKASKTVK